MLSFSVIFLIFLVVMDIRMLRSESETCFLQSWAGIFRKLFSMWGIGAGIALVVLYAVGGIDARSLIEMLMGILVLFYVWQRRGWLVAIDKEKTFYQEGFTHKRRLAIGCFGVVFYWFSGMAILSAVYQLFFAWSGLDVSLIGELVIATLFSSVMIMGLIYLASSDFSPRGFKFNIGWRNNGLSFARLYLLPMVLGLIFAGISSSMLLGRDVQPRTPFVEMMESADSPGLAMIILMMALVMAPLVEELTFRGYFYHVLKHVKGKLFAIIGIALIFGFLHVNQYWGDWQAIIMVGCLGFALTGLRASTGSVITSTVMHYTYNLSVTVIPVVVLLVQNPAYVEYQAQGGSYSFEQKESLLLRNIQQSPSFSEAYYELALLYFEDGRRLKDALALIDQALRRDPESYFYLDIKADILSSLGEYESALQIRENLVDRDFSGDWKKEQIRKRDELKALLSENSDI